MPKGSLRVLRHIRHEKLSASVSTPHGAIEVAWKFECKKVRLGLGVLVGVEGVLEHL